MLNPGPSRSSYGTILLEEGLTLLHPDPPGLILPGPDA